MLENLSTEEYMNMLKEEYKDNFNKLISFVEGRASRWANSGEHVVYILYPNLGIIGFSFFARKVNCIDRFLIGGGILFENNQFQMHT